MICTKAFSPALRDIPTPPHHRFVWGLALDPDPLFGPSHANFMLPLQTRFVIRIRSSPAQPNPLRFASLFAVVVGEERLISDRHILSP